MLSLLLLGDAAVEVDQGRITGRCAQRHQIALLALLATAPRQTLSRDNLLGFLWPESDTKHARNLLNVTVYSVRRALCEDALISIGDRIRLNGGRWRVDVAEFEAALAMREAERAVSLYGGPFLDGFFLGDAPEFNRWQEGERDRLAQRCAGALQALAASAEAEGDPAKAAEWWRKLAAHDPYDSSAALGLMRTLARAGNRAGAVQHGRAHATLLRDELGVEPSREVTAFPATLSDEVAAATTPAARSAATPSPHHAQPASDRPLEVRSSAADADTFDRDTAAADTGSRPASVAGTLPPVARGASLRGAVTRAALALPLALAGPAVAWLGGANGMAHRERPEAGAAAIPSIAVLPFVNVGGDTANQYFADGMTDELTAALQKVPGLRVLSRRSAFAFKDSTGMDVRRIGQQLGVGTVLEGSVRRDGDRLRVTAEVAGVHDGLALWSETYERDRRDVFAVQDEIARAIAGALSLALGGDRVSLAPAGTRSLEAHELYLRARFLVNNAASEQSIRQGITFYEHALIADPRYALAWAGIADAWSWLADWYVPPKAAYPLAKAAALRALALDSTRAEAHAALAAVQAAYDWDFAAAERSARHALALSHNSADVLVSATWPLVASGSLDSAISVSRRARALDPLSASTGFTTCWALTAAGRSEEAIGEAHRMLALDADEPLALWAMGHALSTQGRHAQALSYFRRAAPIGPLARSDLARTLAALGRRDEALRLVHELERESERRDVAPAGIASVYVQLGDRDAAFRWLERAYRLRSAELTSLRHRRAWDPIRNDPRFRAILRRVWGDA